jgi:type 1 fimbria pilin
MKPLKAHRMKLFLPSSFWKTAFAWVLLGALVIGHAQTPDQGSLVLAGTITKTTCVLNFGDAQSTLAGRKTLSFGSIPTSQIPQGLGQGFENVAPKQTVILSVTNADGKTCDSLGTGKWDVGVSINPSRLHPQFNLILLSDGDRSATPRAFTEEIGIKLETTVNGTVGATEVRLDKPVFTPVGGAGTFTLLSNSLATTPTLLATDKLALSAQYLTLTTGPKSPGAYSAAVALSVFYL